MDKEGFLENIRRQYSEEIHTAYLKAEREHGQIDYVLLQQSLFKLMKHARVEGLPPKDFTDLVKSVLPEAWTKLEGSGFRLAA